MLVKLKSVRPASFTGNDGKLVEGFWADVEYKASDRIFLSKNTDITGLKEGGKYEFDFNNKGRLLSITPV